MSRTFRTDYIHSCPCMQYYLYKCPSFLLVYMSILQSSILCVRRNLSGACACPEDPGHPAIYLVQRVRRIPVTLRSIQCVRRIPGHPSSWCLCPGSPCDLSGAWVPCRPPCDLLPCTSTQCVWCIQGDPACKSLICATKNISMQCTKKLLKNLSSLWLCKSQI